MFLERNKKNKKLKYRWYQSKAELLRVFPKYRGDCHEALKVESKEMIPPHFRHTAIGFYSRNILLPLLRRFEANMTF